MKCFLSSVVVDVAGLIAPEPPRKTQFAPHTLEQTHSPARGKESPSSSQEALSSSYHHGVEPPVSVPPSHIVAPACYALMHSCSPRRRLTCAGFSLCLLVFMFVCLLCVSLQVQFDRPGGSRRVRDGRVRIPRCWSCSCSVQPSALGGGPCPAPPRDYSHLLPEEEYAGHAPFGPCVIQDGRHKPR